jgi:hypothetical protein
MITQTSNFLSAKSRNETLFWLFIFQSFVLSAFGEQIVNWIYVSCLGCPDNPVFFLSSRIMTSRKPQDANSRNNPHFQCSQHHLATALLQKRLINWFQNINGIWSFLRTGINISWRIKNVPQGNKITYQQKFRPTSAATSLFWISSERAFHVTILTFLPYVYLSANSMCSW